ncbi:MAG TPA: TetR/AcrR family transcriptional regulator [Acidimicrobiales bacterium]|nr:TetR/AcrR family transcriptional regulator [Acidimicrobiales bacterium]
MARARQARSVETRGRLLAAARAAIAEHGIDGASVDAIAERAERTSGSLYGQFGSKEGLLVALLDESKDLVAESMLVDIEAATSLDERLAALWHNFSRPPPAAGDWVHFEHEVWVWATRPGNEAVRTRLGERYRTEFASLAAALDAWAAEGLIELPGPSEGVATVVVSMLIGLEMSYRLEPASVDEAAVVRALRALLGASGAPTSAGSAVAGAGTAGA